MNLINKDYATNIHHTTTKKMENSEAEMSGYDQTKQTTNRLLLLLRSMHIHTTKISKQKQLTKTPRTRSLFGSDHEKVKATPIANIHKQQ
jgi:hypothetical protein